MRNKRRPLKASPFRPHKKLLLALTRAHYDPDCLSPTTAGYPMTPDTPTTPAPPIGTGLNNRAHSVEPLSPNALLPQDCTDDLDREVEILQLDKNASVMTRGHTEQPVAPTFVYHTRSGNSDPKRFPRLFASASTIYDSTSNNSPAANSANTVIDKFTENPAVSIEDISFTATGNTPTFQPTSGSLRPLSRPKKGSLRPKTFLDALLAKNSDSPEKFRFSAPFSATSSPNPRTLNIHSDGRESQRGQFSVATSSNDNWIDRSWRERGLGARFNGKSNDATKFVTKAGLTSAAETVSLDIAGTSRANGRETSAIAVSEIHTTLVSAIDTAEAAAVHNIPAVMTHTVEVSEFEDGDEQVDNRSSCVSNSDVEDILNTHQKHKTDFIDEEFEPMEYLRDHPSVHDFNHGYFVMPEIQPNAFDEKIAALQLRKRSPSPDWFTHKMLESYLKKTTERIETTKRLKHAMDAMSKAPLTPYDEFEDYSLHGRESSGSYDPKHSEAPKIHGNRKQARPAEVDTYALQRRQFGVSANSTDFSRNITSIPASLLRKKEVWAQDLAGKPAVVSETLEKTTKDTPIWDPSIAPVLEGELEHNPTFSSLKDWVTGVETVCDRIFAMHAPAHHKSAIPEKELFSGGLPNNNSEYTKGAHCRRGNDWDVNPEDVTSTNKLQNDTHVNEKNKHANTLAGCTKTNLHLHQQLDPSFVTPLALGLSANNTTTPGQFSTMGTDDLEEKSTTSSDSGIGVPLDFVPVIKTADPPKTPLVKRYPLFQSAVPMPDETSPPTIDESCRAFQRACIASYNLQKVIDDGPGVHPIIRPDGTLGASWQHDNQLTKGYSPDEMAALRTRVLQKVAGYQTPSATGSQAASSSSSHLSVSGMKHDTLFPRLGTQVGDQDLSPSLPNPPQHARKLKTTESSLAFEHQNKKECAPSGGTFGDLHPEPSLTLSLPRRLPSINGYYRGHDGHQNPDLPANTSPSVPSSSPVSVQNALSGPFGLPASASQASEYGAQEHSQGPRVNPLLKQLAREREGQYENMLRQSDNKPKSALPGLEIPAPTPSPPKPALGPALEFEVTREIKESEESKKFEGTGDTRMKIDKQ